MHYTLAVLVQNEAGVLNRVTSLFRRRQFNIDSLTVSMTESPDVSRITVTFQGDEGSKVQLMSQLYKLPVVVNILELDSDNAVSRELLLIKMANDPETREAIHTAVSAFEAKIVDYARDSMIIQLTGGSRRLDNFINVMRDYTILEICRTGVVALERGGSTIKTSRSL